MRASQIFLRHLPRLFGSGNLQKSTSAFSKQDIELLNIKYIGTNSMSDMFPTKPIGDEHRYLLLRNIGRQEIITTVLETDSRYSDMEKTVLNSLQRIIQNETSVSTQESKTDDLVALLLNSLRFHVYPLHLSSKPNYKLDIANVKVTAIPEYSVERGNKVLFVDEDKHIKNTSRVVQWGEYQLAGEMLVSAISKDPIGDVTVHGMRVVGTKFTFYRSTILEKYYLELGGRLPMKESMEVLRYPHKSDSNKLESMSLDYTDPAERHDILQGLVSLKSYLLI